MTTTELQHPSPQNSGGTASSEQPLGNRAARGFAWAAFETVATKLLSSASQVALAWLLAREHFGLIGLAHTVTAFTTLTDMLGLPVLLVQRQKTFKQWASSALWISSAMSLVGGLVTAAAAPLAARLYQEPEVIPILLVLASVVPIRTAGLVPESWLRVKLRFRLLTLLSIATTVATALLSVFLAWRGYGAMSFVLPQPIVAAGRAIATWLLARPPVDWGRGIRGWRGLLPDSAKLLGWTLVTKAMAQCDYFFLGIWHDTATVGLYFFAFNLSIQMNQIVLASLSRVLFPVLSRLNDSPVRQQQGFLRSARLVTFIGVPAYLTLTVLAEPFVHACFAEQWAPAVPLLEILSASMVLRVVLGPSISMMNAQGRFSALLKFHGTSAPILLSVVAIAAATGGPIAVAWTIFAWSFVPGPVLTYLAIRPGGGRWLDVINIYVAPLVAGAVATISTLLILSVLPSHAWLRLFAGGVLMALIYAPLVRILAPNVWLEFWTRTRALHPRLRRT